MQELSDLLASKDSCEGQPDSDLVQKKAGKSLEERCSWALLEGVRNRSAISKVAGKAGGSPSRRVWESAEVQNLLDYTRSHKE